MTDDRQFIPLLEEQYRVTKDKRVTGRVTVSTRTETDSTMVPIELANMDVEVVRVPVDRPIDKAPDVVVDGDLTIVPVVEERVVVTRQLYLREEVHIRRIGSREVTELPIETRRQVAQIERASAEADDPSVIAKGTQDDL